MKQNIGLILEGYPGESGPSELGIHEYDYLSADEILFNRYFLVSFPGFLLPGFFLSEK